MQTKQLSLSIARWIVLALYFTGLVTYPVVGAFVKPVPGLPPEVSRILPVVLLGVGVAVYVVSLVVEAMVLARAKRSPNPVGVAASAAILTGACGESLAILGLVLTLLGARTWGTLLYGLCFVHGVHLMLRWPNFEQVAAGDGM